MTDMTRRAFTAAAASAGFALAVQPISAETITTPEAGLSAGMVKFATSGLEMDAYRAAPEGKTGAPVILVVQEIFGLHEHIRDVCRRFAREGFYAIAPNLYQREGDATAVADIQTLVETIVSKVPDAQVMADLDAVLEFARGEGADADRAGVTGFCWGGRVTWLYAHHRPATKAGVAWYGRLVGEANELRPTHPVDIGAQLAVPVLGLYGGADRGIPNETVEQMRAEIAKSSSGSDIVLYPDAPHGFLADYRDTYRADVAADAWGRCVAWFRTHGLA